LNVHKATLRYRIDRGDMRDFERYFQRELFRSSTRME
jgi:hypothetical protein